MSTGVMETHFHLRQLSSYWEVSKGGTASGTKGSVLPRRGLECLERLRQKKSSPHGAAP